MTALHRLHFFTLPSTQAYAMAAWERGVNPPVLGDWYLYTADAQTQGQGQHQRAWASPNVGNIYATYAFALEAPGALTKRSVTAENFGVLLQLLPHAAAVSVADTLLSLGFSPTVKWVNDVWIGQRKVAGILVNTRVHQNSGKTVWQVFMGIGLNVNMSEEECRMISPPATSLRNETGIFFDTEAVLAQLSTRLQQQVLSLFQGNAGACLAAYRARLNRLEDFSIAFECHEEGALQQKSIPGKIEGISDRGGLLWRQAGAEKVREFLTGRIVIKR